eukprot:SAG31_NODE_33_length_32018_cov_69.763088_22_plen_100_part_00
MLLQQRGSRSLVRLTDTAGESWLGVETFPEDIWRTKYSRPYAFTSSAVRLPPTAAAIVDQDLSTLSAVGSCASSAAMNRACSSADHGFCAKRKAKIGQC